MKPFLYFAAPLFSQAELAFNERVCAELEPFFNVYLPQRDGGLIGQTVGKGGLSAENALARTFAMDIAAIDRSDVVLLVLDGRTVDEGAAFEIGYAFAKGKVCVGLQTDPRRLVPWGNNPMITGPLVNLFSTVESLVAWAGSFAPLVAPIQRGAKAPL
jgi:nucleoside 2-deoxyribosyltransferase